MLAHVRSVERGDERQEEMHTIPETPPDVVEVEEEAEEEIQLSQVGPVLACRRHAVQGQRDGVGDGVQRWRVLAWFEGSGVVERLRWPGKFNVVVKGLGGGSEISLLLE